MYIFSYKKYFATIIVILRIIVNLMHFVAIKFEFFRFIITLKLIAIWKVGRYPMEVDAEVQYYGAHK